MAGFSIGWIAKNKKKSSAAALAALVASVFAFSPRSINNLADVRPELQMLSVCAVQKMQSPVSFIVVDGMRTLEEHLKNLAAGRSQAKRSRHQDGAAIDFAVTIETGEFNKDGKPKTRVTYDPPHYFTVADAFKECSKIHRYPIVWGGDWKSFKDYMHIELDRKVFP